MANTILEKSTQYIEGLKATIDGLDMEQVSNAIGLIKDAWQKGKQVFCFGNGGSALTAQHYATDWSKGVYCSTGKPFYARCLADNIGIVSAYGNDFSYEDIFIQQLKPVLAPGDLVIGISGSGNSENVIRAIQYANENGAATLGICGYSGGRLKQVAQHCVWVNVNDMQIAEDVHLLFGHMAMQVLCTSCSAQS